MEKKLEVKRQLFHIILGLALVVLLDLNILNLYYMIALCVIGIIISFISKKRKIPGVHWFLKHFERPENFRTLPGKGAFTFLLGCTITIAIFPKETALAGIIILTLGDSFSHLVGRFLGRTKHPLSKVKLIEGSLAGTLIGAISAAFYVPFTHAFIASFIAMGFEAMEVKLNEYLLDDNLILPIIAGAIIELIKIYFVRNKLGFGPFS